jgi:SagB-type dehydrogenase family enzyme
MPVGSWRRERRGPSVRAAVVAVVAASCVLVAGSAGGQEARVIPLPEPRLEGPVAVEAVLAQRRSVRAYAPDTLSLEDASQLLWAAQGVTWRPGGEERGEGLRTAPSAGARYPLETYLVAGRVHGLEAGLYRYVPAEHALVAVLPGDLGADLAAAAIGQRALAEAPAVLVVAGVYARTEGRYGGRAQRYVHMEVGAVAQNVALQAVALGLGSVYVGAFRDDAVRELLALPADHAPLALLPVGRPAVETSDAAH